MNTAMRAGVFGMVAAVVMLSAGSVLADTHLIKPDGTGDFPTIQDAVNAAYDDDIIELADGTFTGEGNRDVMVPSRPITIRSENADYMNCIIDCEGSARAEHRGFRFVTAVGTGDPLLKDIAIINGYVSDGGGGIWVEGASPEIRDCAIAMCTVAGSTQYGGGVYVTDGGDPALYFCLITGNTADYGAGIAIRASGGIYWDCEIGDNVATDIGGGMYISEFGGAQVAYCDIVSNDAARGGGLRMSGGNLLVSNCSISRNDASNHSGGVWLQGGVLSNCTIVENSAPTGGGVYCLAGSGLVYYSIIAFTEAGHGVGADIPDNAPYLNCCDVYGNVDGNYDSVVGDLTGTIDNFSLDPELCGIDIEDYRLFDTSPCLPSGPHCGELVGRWGAFCNSPVQGMSWGRVKALWR